MSSGQDSVSFLPKSCNFVKWATNLHGCALRYCMDPILLIPYFENDQQFTTGYGFGMSVFHLMNQFIQAHGANLP